MGKKVNVRNKCVTFMSNVGSEQTFENLVDNFGSTEKKSMTFEISECLGSQYYHSLLNLFLIKICSF